VDEHDTPRGSPRYAARNHDTPRETIDTLRANTDTVRAGSTIRASETTDNAQNMIRRCKH
jgi:hypothetical protein